MNTVILNYHKYIVTLVLHEVVYIIVHTNELVKTQIIVND